MIRILKTDLFRLFRSKVILAFPIVLTISLIFSMLFANVVDEQENQDIPNSPKVPGGIVCTIADPDKLDRNYPGLHYNDTDKPMQIIYTEEDGVEVNITIQPGEAFISTDEDFKSRHVFVGLTDLFDCLYDGFILLFMGLTIIIFSTCETRSGFVKNAAGCAIDRRYMPLSKMIVGIVAIVMYTIEFIIYRFLGTFIECMCTGRSFYWTKLPEGDNGKFWQFIIVCVLVHLAIDALLVMMHELAGNRALGIVFAVIFSFGIFEKLAQGVVYLLNHFFHILEGFDINKYLLIMNIGNGYNDAAYHQNIAIILALVYLVVGTVLAMMITKKRDVR
ncbi:MAG: hypothetical protein IKU06_00325 [Lachnospiraceae bacterium]|nr:hypothetical protein [Lachnospiraceae bacterium]